MSTIPNLCLDLLCTLLSAAAHGKDTVGEGPDKSLVLQHVAFALGELLIEPITTGDRYGFTLTPRGSRVHELLCDPERRPEMQAMVARQNGFALADWLEARFPLPHRQR